eukprot:scaffold7921_cov109-Isochrysis_galbana.AAC.1
MCPNVSQCGLLRALRGSTCHGLGARPPAPSVQSIHRRAAQRCCGPDAKCCSRIRVSRGQPATLQALQPASDCRLRPTGRHGSGSGVSIISTAIGRSARKEAPAACFWLSASRSLRPQIDRRRVRCGRRPRAGRRSRARPGRLARGIAASPRAANSAGPACRPEIAAEAGMVARPLCG